MNFSRILVHPSQVELERVVRQAVVAAKGKASRRVLAWPLPDWDGFLRELATRPEGWRQWNGGKDHQTTAERSVVGMVWWSDYLGRKHCRVVAGRYCLDEAL